MERVQPSQLFVLSALALLLAITSAWDSYLHSPQALPSSALAPQQHIAAVPPPTEYAPPACAQAATGCNCADFASQRAAIQFFRWSQQTTGLRDKHGLDADHDAQACETLPFK